MVRRRGKHFDYVIALAVGLLIIIGFAALASASSDLGKVENDDPYYYIKHQFLYGFSFGIAGFIAALYIDYRKYKKIAPILFFIGIGGLILTFTPLAIRAGGASRWIDIGPITFQPSEILKIAFITYVAAWIANRSERQSSWSEVFVPFVSICGIVAVMLLLQRSTSAAFIIMCSAFAIYFVGGANKKHIAAVIAAALVLFAGIIVATPYRLLRVKTFLGMESGVQGSDYQINQAITTIGSGGLTGVGYGQSTIKTSLPERIGDSIFAVIAEEFGFIGSTILIMIFLALVMRAFLLARRSRDQFGKLLLVGFGTIIGIQALLHMGGNSGLVPLTGVPLPFISYGGTALAIFMTMSGIMLNISKKV